MKKRIEMIWMIAIMAVMEAVGWITFAAGLMGIDLAGCGFAGLVGWTFGLAGIIFTALMIFCFRHRKL